MPTINSSSSSRLEVTAANGANARVRVPNGAVVYGKGAGKLQKTLSTPDQIAAGTAVWFDVDTFANADYTDTDKYVADAAMAYRILGTGAGGVTVVVVGAA